MSASGPVRVNRQRAVTPPRVATSTTRRPAGEGNAGARTLALDLATVIDLVADRVVEKLRAAQGLDAVYDQDNLPEGMTRRSFLEAARRGVFPSHKLGRRVVATRADVEAWRAKPRPPNRANRRRASDVNLVDVAARAGFRVTG